MIKLKHFIAKPIPWLCLVLLIGIFCTASWAKDVAVIKIKYRWARELVPIVQSMLSADGSVTVSERVNSLVIVDNQEAILRVRAYLAKFNSISHRYQKRRVTCGPAKAAAT
jgi:type II secretory pathway component HofQ